MKNRKLIKGRGEHLKQQDVHFEIGTIHFYHYRANRETAGVIYFKGISNHFKCHRGMVNESYLQVKSDINKTIETEIENFE